MRRFGGLRETISGYANDYDSCITKLYLSYDKTNISKQTLEISNINGEKILKLISYKPENQPEIITIYNKEKELQKIKMADDYNLRIFCNKNFFTITLNKELFFDNEINVNLFVFDYKGNELFGGKQDSRIADNNGKTKQ